MPLSSLAYACALIPTITVHLTLGVALWSDNLHACIPYWSYCHSISATGRQYPEFFIFKGLMLPAATLMVMYWYALYRWMEPIAAKKVSLKAVLWLGLIASLALIVYTLTLGAIGEPYALARRIGVILFFAFTAFAHLLFAAQLYQVKTLHPRVSTVCKQLLRVCQVLIVIGLLSSLLGFFWSGYKNWDNAFEWWFALLMMGQFVLVGRLWANSHYQLTLSLKH